MATTLPNESSAQLHLLHQKQKQTKKTTCFVCAEKLTEYGPVTAQLQIQTVKSPHYGLVQSGDVIRALGGRDHMQTGICLTRKGETAKFHVHTEKYRLTFILQKW